VGSGLRKLSISCQRTRRSLLLRPHSRAAQHAGNAAATHPGL